MKKPVKFITNNLYLKKGMTLTELLIASILIGIVMVGVFSFSQAVKQIHQSTDRSTIPAARVASAMARIVSDGNLMSGDGYWETGDPVDIGSGLFIYEDAGTSAYGICFRHDTDDDPAVFTNDQWVCYAHNGDRMVWRCTVTEANVGTFTACPAGGMFAKPVIDLAVGSEDFFNVTTHTENGRDVLDEIEITLTTKIDPDDAGNDPMINPSFSLTATINPWAQGR